jgi:menaquinol-cytochrome c reductase iron-sulfur subunit
MTLTRREFLTRLTLALGGVAAALVGAPTLGFLFAPLWEQSEREWRGVGDVNAFAIGTTREVAFDDATPLPWAGVSARTAAWLRRESADRFVAYAVNCTHLGCPVRWLESATLFMCPCHGGVYYQDGTVAAGPPPHRLAEYPVRVRNGQVEIRTSALPTG